MASTNPVSPKVKWGALWGIILTVAATAVSGVVAALDPSLIPGAGPYAVLIVGVLTTAGNSLAAYLKNDALREQGLASASANAIATVEASTADASVPAAPATPPGTTFGTDTTTPTL